jgi:enamine deaminase RidA (YjgF/YER057c/UK114 family)
MQARLTAALLLASTALAQPPRPIRIDKREKAEPVTQTLEAVQDPPAAILVETGRLVFHVSPLSGKGLLSQQIRDALKSIDKANGGATLVKIRAFVAGNGDMRRVQAIVTEDFSDHKTPLPAISTIQVGALPQAGAQVVIEAISADKKVVNPSGLAFFSATRTSTVSEAVAMLRSHTESANIKPAGVLRVTCFLNSLEPAAEARDAISSAFPSAASNFVQVTRLGLEKMVACEAVGRLESKPAQPMAIAGTFAEVNTPKLILSATQMAFHGEDADIRLAFDRLRKSLDATNGKDPVVFYMSSYPLTKSIQARVQAIGDEFFHPGGKTPAGTSILFEALPSLDATAAIEVVAAVP